MKWGFVALAEAWVRQQGEKKFYIGVESKCSSKVYSLTIDGAKIDE